MAPNQVVEVTVKLEQGDYVYGYLWAYYLGTDNRTAVVGLVLLLLLMFFGLDLLRRISPIRLSPPAMIGPIISVAVILGLPLYTFCRAHTAFRQHQWLHQPTRYTFDSRGIASKAISYSGFREWSRVWRVEENGRAFLIYLSQSQVVVIPKRFFQSLDQTRTLREIVAEYCVRVSLLDT